MIEQAPHTLDDVFHALADPTRRSMLRSLAAGQQTISQLAAPYDTHICQLEPRPLAVADRWLRSYEQLWTTQLDALAALFEDDNQDLSGEAPSASPQRRPPERRNRVRERLSLPLRSAGGQPLHRAGEPFTDKS